MALVPGHDGGNGRAANALQALDNKRGAHHQGSGGAGGNQCIAPALCQSPAGDSQGTVFILLQQRTGVRLHGDEPLSGQDFHAGKVDGILFCTGADELLVSTKQNVTAKLRLRRSRALQNLQRRIVAAKGIDDDLHK